MRQVLYDIRRLEPRFERREAGRDKASHGETDWRDVRALLIYQDKDLAATSRWNPCKRAGAPA